MNMFSAFGMIIIARHQMLLFDDSKIKMSGRLKTGARFFKNELYKSNDISSVLCLRVSSLSIPIRGQRPDFIDSFR